MDAKGSYALVRAPGITYIADLGDTGRGLAIFAGQLWAVAGNHVLSINSVTGGTIQTSTEIPGTTRVNMAATVDRLCVVAQQRAWLTTAASIVTEITDTDFRPAGVVDFIDQYLVFTETNSGRWFCSDLNTPASYTSANFATAEHQPDELLGLIADLGQVLLAGSASMELWQNDGSSGFPFSRISNGVIELGCAAGQSLAKLDNSIFWLASDLTVRLLSGFTPVRVTTHGIETIIASWGDVSDCYAMTYSFGGHLV